VIRSRPDILSDAFFYTLYELHLSYGLFKSIVMPIYEYQALDLNEGCIQCAKPFEVIQRISDKPLAQCPACGECVTKLISRCRIAVAEYSDVHRAIGKQIATYEGERMWTHAAELADKHSEEMRDPNMKLRAIDNYSKAGYDTALLEKHAKAEFENSDCTC
jgi:putative FmdB family regulatory protein